LGRINTKALSARQEIHWSILSTKLKGNQMKNVFRPLFIIASLTVATAAFAAEEYNSVPAGDAQYASCLAYSLTKYEGGGEKSPIKGQTKAEAWCTCMWNETSEDFKGSLAKFAETAKGAKTNKMCEKYSNWGE
jgi:hypothetical protein